ncbi:MAG: hypothetical protein RL768_1616, partial [Nitrospirota bacterium]
MNTQVQEGPARILLVGTAALHRDPRWVQLARRGFQCIPVNKRQFTLNDNLTAGLQAIIYQVGAGTAETM